MTAFELDGVAVEVTSSGTLLDALREELRVTSPKDGCSPQGQCGCCTVWVDGRPRVACVTPVTRVAGRSVTTVDGLPGAARWAEAFVEAGASQCGFCTPGIIMRLAALGPAERASSAAVRTTLLAHLCRCTGWQTIVEAAAAMAGDPSQESDGPQESGRKRSDRAVERAAVEGRTPQAVGAEVALGRGGFADDHAPAGALVAVRRGDGSWVTGADRATAVAASSKVQGRRTTAPVTWPIELPEGDWARTLRTTWVEPAYLEPDAAWCEPGGEPSGPLGNGGAFGGKVDSEVSEVARRLADEHGRPVRASWSREDVVRSGPKRPPVAVGLRADGSGVVRVARTAGIVDAIAVTSPGSPGGAGVGTIQIVEVDVIGPPTSSAIRGAGWVELAVVRSALGPGPHDTVTSPDGAVATARLDAAGEVHVRVRCGVHPDDADEAVVARSYCIGAAHMALGWVREESIAVDEHGVPLDLTIRSFGVLRAVDTPAVHVTFDPAPLARPDAGGTPGDMMVNGSDVVFAAVAAAAWRAADFAPEWPVRHRADSRR